MVGNPSGEGCGVQDLALGGVVEMPVAARLVHERAWRERVPYGLLTDRARRRPAIEDEEDIL
jgi:hypothetical protein